MQNRNIKSNKGFSLLEVVVMVAIFVITVMVVIDLFLTTTELQKRAVKKKEVENNALLLLDSTIKHVKHAEIDYEFYSDMGVDIGVGENPTHILAISDNINTAVIRRSGDAINLWSGTGNDIEICSVIDVEDMECDDSYTWQTYAYGDIEVKDFKIIISPGLDPNVRDSGGLYIANDQQAVTIYLSVEGPGAKANEKITVNLQTSVSLSVYKR